MGDFIRKFDIPLYSGSRIYGKYEIVKQTSINNSEYYFVSAQDSNQTHMDTSGFQTSNVWWKRIDDFNNDFSSIWTPSYTTAVEVEPRVVDSTLDDGTTLIARDGINTVPLKFTLVFENIKDVEAKSLLCFFDYMGASRAFNWTIPTPYNTQLKFNLLSLKHSFVKKNCHTITVAIEQSFVIFGVGAGQVKAGAF